MFEMVLKATFETLYMVGISTTFTILLGLPLGIVLVITSKGHILENAPLHTGLSYAVNMTRSLPFIILMIFIIPFTRVLVGTSIGTRSEERRVG